MANLPQGECVFLIHQPTTSWLYSNIKCWHLNCIHRVWAPGHTDIIYDHNFSDKTRTGDLSGTDYLNLFKAIQHLDTFSDWMSMHVCNISPEEVSGYRDGYMYADQISDHGDMVEDDYEERDAALHY